MKRAFLDQMFLGWIALAAMVLFIATVSDEKAAKNKYYDLSDLADNTMQALSQEYFKNMQGDLTSGNTTTVMNAICSAQNTATNILMASSLGSDLFNNNKINYIWRDAGTYNATTGTYDGVPDGRPDTISVQIGSYTKTNFWYKFFDKDTFELPGFTKAADLNQFSYNTNVFFRGVIEAGYHNMVGTYTLDANGCPQNGKLILASKTEWASKIGELMANIQMPQTKMFFIADGYRTFGNYNSSRQTNSTISEENTRIDFVNPTRCDQNSTTYPTIRLTTDDGRVQSSINRSNVFFQDNYLNFDGKVEHTREIAEKDWGAFVAVTESSGNWNQEAWDYYNSLPDSQRTYNRKDLKLLAPTSNAIDIWDNYVSDRGLTPNYDPTNSYVSASEDLALPNSDRDFSDMSFSMTKIFIPEPIDPEDIADDSIINVNCP